HEGGHLTTAALSIDERVLHFLAGTPHMDERLATIVEPLASAGALAPAQVAIADQIVRLWTTMSSGGGPISIVQLVGEGASDKVSVIAGACRRRAARPFMLRAASPPTAPADLDQLSRSVERESVL